MNTCIFVYELLESFNVDIMLYFNSDIINSELLSTLNHVRKIIRK